MEELLKQLLPEGFNLQAILDLVVVLYAFIVSLYNVGAKKRVIKSDIQKTNAENASTEAKQASDDAKKSATLLGNMLLTIFLNANTLGVDEKKQLVYYANKLKELANVELDEKVVDVLKIVEKFNPESTILQKKEQLINTANKAEEVIDTASSVSQDLIDKLDL